MTRLLELPDVLLTRNTHFVYDDFYGLDTTQWATLAADSGASVAASDTAAGVAVLTTGGTDNNECALKTKQKVFLFAANKPLVFEARLQYSEVATNTTNLLAGLHSALGADVLADNGAGPVSGSGVFVYKADGGTVWHCCSQIGSTAIDTASQSTAGDANQVTLRIEFKPFSATQADVTFFLNDAPLLDANTRPIKHTFTYTSAAAMFAGVYCKTGSANSQVVNVDSIFCGQRR